MRRRLRIFLGAWAVACAFVGVAAGTVTVRVVDRAGEGIRGVRVEVALAERPYGGRRGESDAAGIVRFDGVDVGTYAVVARLDPTSDRVPPGRNPFVAEPRVTLLADDDDAEVALELWRGSPVVLEVRADGERSVGRTLVMSHRETGEVLAARTDRTGVHEETLVPGAWTFRVDPAPNGLLLTDVTVDGRSVSGVAAEVVLEAFAPRTFVTWHYSAPARIEGRVDVVRGRGRPNVVAVLVEPGPTALAARERGSPIPGRVFGAYYTDSGLYEMEVPDGTWTVGVYSELLTRAEPETVELRVAAGDVGVADFVVEMEDAARGVPLRVEADLPDVALPWRLLQDVTYELWSVDDDGRPRNRLRRESHPFGKAVFHGVSAGSYVVSAHHPAFLEGTLAIEWDPGAAPDEAFVVPIEAGIRVEALAVDEADRPVEEVELRLSILGEVPEFVTDDETFRRGKLSADVRTDASGFAAIDGRYPAEYRATAKLRGERAATHFVAIEAYGAGRLSESVNGAGAGGVTPETRRVVDEPGDTLDLVLNDDASLALRVLPAATLRLRLACLDGGPFPESASARVFPVDVAHRPRHEDPDLVEGAWLALDGLPLSGRLADTLEVGPLEADSLQLAVRPTGFGLWTWAYGTERRAAAANFNTVVGRVDDLGVVGIDCAPAIELVPTYFDGGGPHDLSATTFEGEVLRLAESGGDAPGEPTGESYEARLEADEHTLMLREMEVGSLRIVGTLHHPHWLPSASIEVDTTATLERGQLAIADLPIEAVGGAVRVFGEAAAARLVPDGAIVPRSAGRVVIESVPVGTYDVEACADARCESPAAVWKDVPVERGRTTKLRPGGRIE